MNHEVPEAFDHQKPETDLQIAAVDPRVGILSFMELRSQAARQMAVGRSDQALEGYGPVASQEPDDEH